MKLLFADFSGARRHSRVLSRFGVARTRDRAAKSPVRATAPRLPERWPRRLPRSRILVPVLDSVSSMPAARYVAREFMSGERMEVHLLYVRTPISLQAACWLSGRDHAAFEREAKALRPVCDLLDAFHIRYVVHVELGDRAPVIVAMARRLDVDRIVLGAARDNTLIRLTEDPVIEKVIDFAEVPVDVVASKSISRLERIGIPLGLGAALGLLCVRSID
jgi:nucleotide-binding universal stress UspA family protein